MSAAQHFTSSKLAPNTALYAAYGEMINVKCGNMMSSKARDEMHTDALAAAYLNHPGAGHYTQALCVRIRGKRDSDWNKSVGRWKDGYDEYRHEGNLPFNLDDPAPNVASAYVFTESGQTLFIGHFKNDAPVNNAQGYQALHFAENGSLTKIAVVGTGEKVITYDLDQELPPTIAALREELTAISAPTRADAMEAILPYVTDIAAESLTQKIAAEKAAALKI